MTEPPKNPQETHEKTGETLEKPSLLFHISDVLSFLYDVPAHSVKVHFPDEREGEKATFRSAANGYLFKKELAVHALRDKFDDPVKLKKLEKTLLGAYPKLKDIPPPPAAPSQTGPRFPNKHDPRYKAALRRWVKKCEKTIGASWLAVPQIETFSPGYVYKNRSFFSNVSENESRHFQDFENYPIAQAVYALGKLEQPRERIPRDDIRSFINKDNENFILIQCLNETQANRRLDKLKKHFAQVGAQDHIRIHSSTLDDEDGDSVRQYYVIIDADKIAVTPGKNGRPLSESLIAYTQKMAEEKMLDNGMSRW